MFNKPEGDPLVLTRNQLREDLVKFPQIIENDPKKWWHETARYVISLRRGLDKKPLEIQKYFEPIIPVVMDMLRSEARLGDMPEGVDLSEYNSLRTETRMVELSMLMARPFSEESEKVHENTTPLDDLPRRHPDNFKLGEKTVKGIKFIDLQVRPSKNISFSHLLIPRDFSIGHKGGGPRGVLDIDQDAPKSMIESEFPWNDIDVAGAGEEHQLRHVANIMGIDPDGLEVFPGDKVNFSDFCLGRDTNQNQIFLDAQGLHYSDEARQAAKTGRINIVGGYQPNKAIYGKDLLVFDGITLAKPRGLMRLIKPVAEGKALEFDYLPLNNVMDFGVFYLFLARKWKDKERFGTYMQRMFEIGKQTSQISPEEENVMQVLERVHTQYPFYDMDKRISNLRELVRYMSGKLIKQIDREFGWTYNIPSGIKVERVPGDDVPKKIYLNGFKPSPQMTEQIIDWWPKFLLECRQRTDEFNSKPIDPLFRYFIKNEIQDAEVDSEEHKE